MKAILAILILTSSIAVAQEKASGTAVAPGCGQSNGQFDVKTDKHQHPMTRPEGGKALVYFIEDDTKFLSRPNPTTRVGVDGVWVGQRMVIPTCISLSLPGNIICVPVGNRQSF